MLKKICTTVAKATQQLFDPQDIAQKALGCGFMQRIRMLEPSQFVTSLLCSLAGGKVDSIAGLLRDHNDDQNKTIDYRAFHDRLSSPHFSTFMLNLLEHVAKKLSISTLDWSSSDSLKRFKDIIIQDGTSFALRDGLAEDFPGRFSTVSPAAVEVHVTMSLKKNTFIAATIAPDSYSERAYLPSPETLKNCLFLGDRGYDGIPYLSEVENAGGFYTVRVRSTHDPIVTSAGSNLPWLKKLEGHHLSWVIYQLEKRKVWDLSVEFSLAKGVKYKARLILRWNQKAKEWVRLVTNVGCSDMTPLQVLSGYRLRWQIELLFKEFKSHSSLKKFQTNNREIVTGLIWGSLLASFLKRFLSHACQSTMSGQAVSTQKMAKIGHRFLRRILVAAEQGREALCVEVSRMIAFVRTSCLRSRPKRDQERGRALLNVQPVVCGA
jgi:hypothetical protein